MKRRNIQSLINFDMKYNNLKSIFDSTRWECTFKDFKKSESQKEKESEIKS